MSDWMPPIEVYMALAEAMHDEDDMCNANQYVPFAECATREYDIEQAVRVCVGLRKADWMLIRRPMYTAPLLPPPDLDLMDTIGERADPDRPVVLR